MKFLRDTAATFVTYALTLVLSMAVNMAIAHALGPVGQGAYALVVVLGATATLALSFGLGPAAAFHMGRRTFTTSELAGNLLATSLIAGIAATVILLVFQPLYSPALPGGLTPALISLTVFIAAVGLAKVYGEYLLIGVGDFTAYNGFMLVDLVSRLVIVELLLIAGVGLSSVALATFLSMALATLLVWRRVGRHVTALRPAFDGALVRQLGDYGRRSYSAGLLAHLNLRIDQLLVGFFLSVADVGIYSAAVILAELGNKLATALTKVLFARVSSLDAASASALTGRTMRITMTLTVLTVAAVAVSGPWLIAILFGRGFAGATVALWLLLPGTLMVSLTQILQSDLSGRGKPEISFYSSLLSVVITVVGNVLLIPWLGIAGAALTATVAYTAGAVLVALAYLHASGQRLHQILWVTRDDMILAKDGLARLVYGAHPGRVKP